MPLTVVTNDRRPGVVTLYDGVQSQHFTSQEELIAVLWSGRETLLQGAVIHGITGCAEAGKASVRYAADFRELAQLLEGNAE